MVQWMNDWYPYHGSRIVIEGLRLAKLKPATCWIGPIGLEDGRRFDNGAVVAIWGRDLRAFRKAVKPADRVEVSYSVGVQPKLDLTALIKELKKGTLE